MYILGLNTYHGDSSACILENGELVTAVEEERFRRIKHWAGFPSEAIRYCLKEVKIEVKDLDHIAVNRNPNSNILKKAIFSFRKNNSFNLVKDRLKNAHRVKGIKSKLAEQFKMDSSKLKAKLYHVEHHVAHLSSTFFVSPFDKAAVVSMDGFGDFVGAMWGVGRGEKIEVKERIYFPHSLGLFYQSITQYLGFNKYGDEYKVMGLAAYGEPVYLDKMRQIIHLDRNGMFKLNLEYFNHHTEGVPMTWEAGEPQIPPVFSQKLVELLGPARNSDEDISERHKNIASSLQAIYEEVFFHLLNYVFAKTKIRTLCLSGGCAMNSVANGKIFDNTQFQEVYIQPAAGDAGGAIGSAFYVWHQVLNQSRSFVLEKPYLGPEFSDYEIKLVLENHEIVFKKKGYMIDKFEDSNILCQKTARSISEGKVVGWFQGRMEWGSRALGNRSIIVDPRYARMKDVLNASIKRREPFRPFAPSILLEKTGDYFGVDYPVPFMLKVYPVRPEKRTVIPAVTHVDGTGRLQTVKREDNILYWQLIKEFEKLTGVPVVLNTSFNENEPIVCTPSEALNCFLRTEMDVLVIGKYMILRSNGKETQKL
ncbi:MAG: carbamoyltransferase C-terminal domain-containing protein [Candidatus Scalindua sediminis]